MNTFFTYFLKNKLCPHISTSIKVNKIVFIFIKYSFFIHFIYLLSSKNIHVLSNLAKKIIKKKTKNNIFNFLIIEMIKTIKSKKVLI